MIVLLGAAGFAVLWAGLLAHGRVRRLHRLHQRLDAARAGLDLALARRAEVAARAGVRVGPAPDRETAANALARDLTGLDRAALAPALHAELAEAEALLTLARHVHNEAVRDTLVLRARRTVRWLRLAGTAPMPAYFETVDTTAVASTPVAGTPVGTTAVATTPVATTPVASTPVASTPVASTPVATTAVAGTPVDTTAVGTAAVASTPVATTAVASTPVGTAAVVGTGGLGAGGPPVGALPHHDHRLGARDGTEPPSRAPGR